MRRANQHLSDTLVDRAKTRVSPYRLWDSRVPGFGAQVYPSGVKSFILQFDRSGSKVFITIGSFPAWSAAKAREEAARLRKLHEEGRDVKAFLEVERTPIDMQALVELWRTDYAPQRKPTTLASYESILKTCILPHLGDRLVKDLTHTDIRALYRTLKAKTPVQAGRACAILSKLFSIAEKEGWRPTGSNPVKGIERDPEKAKDRVLSAQELQRLEDGLVALVTVGWKSKNFPDREPSKLDPMVADLVRFLAFSGLRRSEALMLRRDAVNRDRGTMRFDDHKTDQFGAKTLPLNSQLEAILQRRGIMRSSVYIFPGLDLKKPFQGFGKLWLRVAETAGLPDVTPHDLRRTFNTTCAEMGYPPQVFDMLLGHRLPGVQGIYTHLNPRGIMAEASQTTANWIEAAMQGKNPRTSERIESPSETLKLA